MPQSSSKSSFKSSDLCAKLAESQAALAITPTDSLSVKELAAVNDAIVSIHKLRLAMKCPNTPGTVDILSDNVSSKSSKR
jgi:hypothetical protein